MERMTLEVRHLCVRFRTEKGVITPVNDVSLQVPEGSIVGIVGESACGKSMTARAVMGLVRAPGEVTGGEIILCGRDIASLPEKARRQLRGSEVSMIFQEPMTSLNPVMKVGKQVAEAVLLHSRCTWREARERTLAAFRDVDIPELEARFGKPRLLIADEPTTALDVTVEAQILKLLEKLRDASTSVLLISHNLGVIARVCDRVYVMYAGQIVEQAETEVLFKRPLHPYTQGLFWSVSSLREGCETLKTIPGVVPNLHHLPEGCSFSLRCDRCVAACEKEAPGLVEIEPGHAVRCLLATR